MQIVGMGVVFNRGRGVQTLEKALEEGWVPPTDSTYSVAEDTLKDKSVLKEMRRADKFSKMACFAAYDAFVDSGLGNEVKSSLGIILATAFGPHVTTFRFLDDILDYGDTNVSPTVFSHSVHNAAASYIALVLGARGPTLTVTQFAHSFHQALIIAQSWLRERRCEYILVGNADQCGVVMEYICRQKLRLAEDGKIKPFLFSQMPCAVPGEGSAFFLVTEGKTEKRYCSVLAQTVGTPDMYLLDSDGMVGDERCYLKMAKGGIPVNSYTPIFGSMLTQSSFSCAAAALMLKNQRHYASPVQDNPFGANICRLTEEKETESVACVRYNCGIERSQITLKR